METKVSISLVRSLIQYAAEHAVASAELCQTVGITSDVLVRPDEQIEGSQSYQLWRHAVEMLGDPDLGLHVGEQTHPSALGLVGFVMLSCNTLGDALQKLIRFTNLLTDGVCGHLHQTGSLAHLEIKVTQEKINALLENPRQQIETTFAAIVTVARVLTGQPLPMLQVEFAHARPDQTSEHARIFSAPVLFSQSTNRIVFRAEAIDYPILLANHELLPTLEAQAEESLRRTTEQETVVSRVQQEIAKQLRGEAPNIQSIARTLGLGERSLQRELAAHETSFRQLLDSARQELALRHLRNNKVSVAEVAFLLGFSEPSAFHRSFKRWTGQTPHAYRELTAPHGLAKVRH